MASIYNFKIDQSATFYRKLIWIDKNKIPINTTGVIAKMQFKQLPSTNVIALDLTSENSGIIVSDDGVIEIKITALQTKTLTYSSYVYDLFITDIGGTVIKLIEGKITVSKAVTN